MKDSAQQRLLESQSRDRAVALALAGEPSVSALAAWVRRRWSSAQRAMEPREKEMLQDLRQRDGVYDPEDLATIRKSGGAEIYMMLTATKCRAAAAWIKDALLPSDGSRPFKVSPTPLPDLPPPLVEPLQETASRALVADLAGVIGAMGSIDEDTVNALKEQAEDAVESMRDNMLRELREEAEQRAIRMEEKIEDQLREGGFYDALEECIDDLVTFPLAVLKGPVVRRRKILKWVPDPETGRFTASVELGYKTEYRRVSPFDIYPLPDTSDLQTGGFFERQRLTVEELYAMLGVPGYSDEAIRAVIDSYSRGGLREWTTIDASRAVAEGRQYEHIHDTDTIDALEFWGRVPGTLLIDWGMDESLVPDRSAAYEANVWLIGNYVIRAALNPHPTGRRPYGFASYEKAPGKVHGKGIPRLIRDCQRMCNAAARALANNMAISSGPQVAIRNTNRVPIGEEISSMYPWKIWQFLPDERGTGEAPVDFFQPDMNVNALLRVFEFFSRLADDQSGVIPSAYGSDRAAGAGRTASGQAMLLNNASKVMTSVIANIDKGIITEVVENQFVHNMMFDDDETIKGDLQVTARGSSAIMVREQAQARRNEFLSLILNSPDVKQIVGLEGLRAILAEVSKTMQLPEDIIPSKEELEQSAQQIAMLQMAQAGALPPEMMAAMGGMAQASPPAAPPPAAEPPMPQQ